MTIIGFDGGVQARVGWRITSPDRAEVVAEGEFDPDTAPLLQEHILEALASRPVVCCDFARVTFLCTAGVRALAQAHRVAVTHGRTLQLTGATGIAGYVLRVTGMLDVLAAER